MDLPKRIPLFPLPNVVLFPGVPLPLHVFEPRYRDMVRDAHAADSIVGMVLLKGEWQKDYYGRPAIFGVGCAGRMVSVEQLPDGRSNILLHGIREFTIVREVGDHTYREAEVNWRPAVVGATIGTDRRHQIGSLLEQFLALGEETPASKLLHDASLSDELMVNFFCYALDLSPAEKQGLLERPSLLERAQNLCDVLEFRLDEFRLTGKPSHGGERYH